jgi:hypothetical protein
MKYVLWLLTLLGTACTSGKVPGGIIPPDKMKAIVFDLTKSDVYVNNYVLKDSSLKTKDQHIKIYEQVFLIHNITKQDFYKSLKYYQQHPNINKTLFDSTEAYANRQRDVMFKETHEQHTDSLKKK